MSSTALTCPYCNALLPAPAGLRLGDRVTCPRCGDSFRAEQLPEAPASSAPPVETSAPLPLPAPRRSNGRIAALVVGVMLLMGGVGLVYALLTVDTRRAHDRALPRKVRRPWLEGRVPLPDEVASPAELAGVGYLPASTGILGAIQVQELLASPIGQELRDRPLPLGPAQVQLDALKEWTGLELEQIEHLLLGVVLREGAEADLTPPTFLVVRTRKPYDAARVRVALKASRAREERSPDGEKRTVYAASVRGIPLQLWLPDEQTVLVGLVSKLDLIPARPASGTDHLAAELRQVIEQRLPVGAPLWLVGHATDWKKTLLPTLTTGVKQVPLLGRLEQVRTLAVWLQPTRPLKLAGAFHCISPEAAQQIATTDLAPRQQADPEAFKFSREGAWLDVQVVLPGPGGK